MLDREPRDPRKEIGKRLFQRVTNFFGDKLEDTAFSEYKFFLGGGNSLSSIGILYVRYRENDGKLLSYVSIQPMRTFPPDRQPILMQEQATTPYGVLPRYSIGPDNKLYESYNTYHLDENGGISKRESIIVNPEIDEQGGYVSCLSDDLIDIIPRLDFVPSRGYWIVPPDGDLKS